MDYKGQLLAENLYYIIIILFGIVAWIAGYMDDNFYTAVNGWLGGLALAVVVCVPDWPFYNRNKVQWLESLPDHDERTSSKKSKTVK